MSLSDRINEDLKTAMKAKDQDTLRALRGIKSALLLAKTEKSADTELDTEAEMRVLQRLAKQRRESLGIYEEQGREDLAGQERSELAVIERYLPKQLSEEEMRVEVKKVIAETGAAGTGDMGKVMGTARERLGGQADGKTLSAIVREELAKL